jgi:5-methylthioribose kinase
MSPPPSASYPILDAGSLPAYLAAIDAVPSRLGGEPGQWQVREVGDGNLNLVFIVEGPAGSLCVKQALPYVRAAGPSWPMSPERAFFEQAYYAAVAPYVGAAIPAIYHYDAHAYCTIMERLTPHIILRHGLMQAQRYEHIGRDIGDYIARACYFSCDFAQPFERKLDGISLFAANKALLRITVDLVFTDPYVDSTRNRHTSPQLDELVGELRRDSQLKLAAAHFGYRFLTQMQALIHGDLHSGSVMVSAQDSRVIDPEFACYGPIGFDLGAFFGNLLLSWFSQPGLAAPNEDRGPYQRWILQQITLFWDSFRHRFLSLWERQAGGDAYPPGMFESAPAAAALAGEREAFMDSLFADMLGFGACKMIRRMLGFAHVSDFESIADPDRRADCEAGALALARLLLTRPQAFQRLDDVIEALPQTTRPARPAPRDTGR